MRLLSHRAAVLAELLRRRCGIEGNLGDLADQPLWWVSIMISVIRWGMLSKSYLILQYSTDQGISRHIQLLCEEL